MPAWAPDPRRAAQSVESAEGERMTKPRYPYVMVTWNDAHGSGDDVTEATLKHRPMVYHSPGWLIRSDADGVSIAVEWCISDDTYRGHTFVPRAMVVSESAITFSRTRKPKT